MNTYPPQTITYKLKISCITLIISFFSISSAANPCRVPKEKTHDAHCHGPRNETELKAAVQAANSNNQPDEINLCGNVIILNTPDDLDAAAGNSGLKRISDNGFPLIIKNGTIRRSDTIVDAFRIFRIEPDGHLIIENLSVENGYLIGGSGFYYVGAGIYNQGVFKAIDSSITHNFNHAGGSFIPSGNGGGIFNGSPQISSPMVSMELIRTSVLNNTADNSGGGIFNDEGATITHITCSSISNNFAVSGVGIRNYGTIDLISYTTIDSNIRNGPQAFGAGIYTSGLITKIENSTISRNVMNDGGGGIAVSGGSISEIINTTISHNTALGAAGILITSLGRVDAIKNSTITDNMSIISGPAGLSAGAAGTLGLIESTIIANNLCPDLGCNPDILGSPASENHNLIGAVDYPAQTNIVPGTPNANQTFAGTLATPVVLILDELDFYGGPTQTVPPLVGPVFSHGVNNDHLLFDQRGPGFPRESFGNTDIGAFQTQHHGVAGEEDDEGHCGNCEDDREENDGAPFGLPLPPAQLPDIKGSEPRPAAENCADIEPAVILEATEEAPQPAAVADNLEVPAGCSLIKGQEHSASLLWLWLFFGLVGLRKLRTLRAS